MGQTYVFMVVSLRFASMVNLFLLYYIVILCLCVLHTHCCVSVRPKDSMRESVLSSIMWSGSMKVSAPSRLSGGPQSVLHLDRAEMTTIVIPHFLCVVVDMAFWVSVPFLFQIVQHLMWTPLWWKWAVFREPEDISLLHDGGP